MISKIRAEGAVRVSEEIIDAAHCSFCLKPRGRVLILMAGNCGYICNECVSVCVEVLSKHISVKTDTPTLKAQ